MARNIDGAGGLYPAAAETSAASLRERSETVETAVAEPSRSYYTGTPAGFIDLDEFARAVGVQPAGRRLVNVGSEHHRSRG
jgi:hypothetical protein